MCLREADRVSTMTPLCLLVTDRARRGHKQPTMYMARQVYEEIHYTMKCRDMVFP